jgi:hypothetical protein
MLSKIKSLLQWAGVDRAIFFTLIGRGWGFISGPISIYLIAKCLSREEQGYFYTFGSILNLQVFFELGLGLVIMQTVSHEMAHLSWTEQRTLTGSPVAKSRLASLFRFALKIYSILAAIALCLLIPVGFWFFASKGLSNSAYISWQIPWVIVVVITGMDFLLTPFYGVLQGCGKVAEFAKRGSWMAVIGSIILWSGLLLNIRLFSAPIQSIVSFVIGSAWILGKYYRCFKDLLATPILEGATISWKKDLLQFQWKVALSWVSGYFIFQLINPVLFRFSGPAEAGRMGMSMRIIDSISGIGTAWISTKSAPFGTYIAQKNFSKLDRIFNLAAKQAVGVILLGGVAFFACYFALLFMGSHLVSRFLDPISLLLLLANAAVYCIISCQATYLRAHKQEPLLANSIVAALITPILLFSITPYYGARGIVIGIFCLNTLLVLPWCNRIFKQKKREWHMPVSENKVLANEV